jgi:serine/threonine protein kinase
MGEVYRARDTRLDRTVAIKILPEHISAKPLARERFEREACAVSSLNHPHICTVHDIGRQDGIDYLVMEFESSRSRFEEKSELLGPQLVGIVQRMDEKRPGVAWRVALYMPSLPTPFFRNKLHRGL